MVGPNNYGFAIGGLPGDGALRSGSELFPDLLLSARLLPLDAISSLEPFFLFKRGDINKCLKAIEKLDS